MSQARTFEARLEPEGRRRERFVLGHSEPLRATAGAHDTSGGRSQPARYDASSLNAQYLLPAVAAVQRQCDSCATGVPCSGCGILPQSSWPGAVGPSLDEPRPQRAARDVEVGLPDDAFEREAEWAAAQLGGAASGGEPLALPPPSRRLGAAAPQSLPSSLGVSSSGRPLDDSARAFFEPRLGRDLGDVRLHSGAEAAASAHRLAARAYTLGAHIVLGDGSPALDSSAGRSLLAHELTHVVQQQGPRARTSPRVQRTPRTLPTHVDATNLLLYPVRGNPTVRAGHLAHLQGGNVTDTSLRERVSAILGEGATLRGLARTLLPYYVTAAIPGAPAAPTEDDLAKALLDYGRHYLTLPAMTEWRAGLRYTLPIELDISPGPVSHLRNDWILDADDVRTRAARVTVAEAALVDTAATAAATAPGAADATAFTTATTDNAARGARLHGQVMSNPYEGAPLATLVLGSLAATDWFEVAMGFMAFTVNHQVSLLESLAPGFTLLSALRSALTAPPVGLSAARDHARQGYVGMLPEDPAVGGLSPDFLVDSPGVPNVDDPNTIYFRRGRTSVDDSEFRKLAALRLANATTAVTLTGSASEEESPSLALARTAVIERQLRNPGSPIIDTQVVDTTSTGARASLGNLAYSEARFVRVSTGAPPVAPDCTTVDPALGRVRTSDPCLPGHSAVETRFTAAQTRAADIMSGALLRMTGADSARDLAMARRFGAGTVSVAGLRSRLIMLQSTVAAVTGSHECGNVCDPSCNGGSLAYSRGPTSTPLMVVCEGVLSADLELLASIIIHESSHATSGIRQGAAAVGRRGTADWAYRWEHMSGSIAEMSPNRSLDNADSYTLFVMDMRDPGAIPAGSLPIEEAPVDGFTGTWTSTQRNSVRHAIANCQKWLIWAGQYVANAYGTAAGGSADSTYTQAVTRFSGSGLHTPPVSDDLPKLAAIQDRYEVLSSRMVQALQIDHAASGSPTSFSAASPLFLWVGSDFFTHTTDTTRGHFLLQKLVEAAPEIDAAQRTAYAELAFDIHGQYAIDHP